MLVSQKLCTFAHKRSVGELMVELPALLNGSICDVNNRKRDDGKGYE